MTKCLSVLVAALLGFGILRADTAKAVGPLDGAIILLECVGQVGGPGDPIRCAFRWVAYNPFTGQPITTGTGFPTYPNTTTVTVPKLPTGPIDIVRPPLPAPGTPSIWFRPVGGGAAVAGYTVVAAEAAVAIYLAYDLKKNSQAMLDPGGPSVTITEPAHELTDYENWWANYGMIFEHYYGLAD